MSAAAPSKSRYPTRAATKGIKKMTSASSGPFIDTSLVGTSFEAKQAIVKLIFHHNLTPVCVETVDDDDEPEARDPVHAAPQVNIPTSAMPSQEFFEQLIVTKKNIQAPQQP
jgi:hypothetical protein